MIFQPFLPLPQIVIIGLLWAGILIWGYLRSTRRSRRSRVLALVRRGALGLTLCVALAGPAIVSTQVEETSNVEIVIAVDRTGSMGAEDWEGSQPRLEGVKRGLEALLDSTPGARYAIITWDSTARVELPLTTDSSAVDSFIHLLHQEISEFSAGSSLNRAQGAIDDYLRTGAEVRPENVRYLVVISDGESTDPNDTGVSVLWEQTAPFIDGGAVLGYGTETGGPMKRYAVGAEETEDYIPDPNDPSVPAVSHLDRANLEQLGEELGLETLINPSVTQVEDLGRNLMEGAEKIEDGRELHDSYRYVLWPLGAVAAVLLTWELGSATWQLLRLRRTHAI